MMVNRIGTQSNIKIKSGATQSGLEMYIQSKIEIAERDGLVYTPLSQGLTYSMPNHTHDKTIEKMGAKSFSEKKQFGLLKGLGTHSVFSSEKVNKGLTPSHESIVYTKQTIEFEDKKNIPINNGLIMKDNNFEYHNPNLIRGTQSSTFSPKNLNKKQRDLGKNAIKNQSINNKMVSRSDNPVNKKKFYAGVNDSTKKIENQPFLQFLDKIGGNETFLNSKNVTVNGELVTDPNYMLKSGDIVRVGIGHYVVGSDRIAIVI
jgi:hypothetical protein